MRGTIFLLKFSEYSCTWWSSLAALVRDQEIAFTTRSGEATTSLPQRECLILSRWKDQTHADRQTSAKCVAACHDMPFSPAVVITEFTPVFMSRARLRASEFGEGGLRPTFTIHSASRSPGERPDSTNSARSATPRATRQALCFGSALQLHFHSLLPDAV
jgi:hypothetical protein